MRRPLILSTTLRAAFASMAIVLAACAPDKRADDETTAVHARAVPRLVSAAEAIACAEIAKLDPEKLSDAEIEKVVGSGPICVFRYTSTSRPVLALASGRSGEAAGSAAVKLNGNLIRLQRASAAAPAAEQAVSLAARPVVATLGPLAVEALDGRARDTRDMTLILEIDQELKVGYGGYFNCSAGVASAAD